MNKLPHQIDLIERIDQLIRLRATGNPKQLAERFDMSESSVYRLIETIKGLGAPVEYQAAYQSYIYTDEVYFHCGFYVKKLSEKEKKKVNGGSQSLQYFNKNLHTVMI